MKLIFVTTNDSKVVTAKQMCAPLGIEIIRRELDIEEIQSDQSEKIARRKAADAFARLQKPLVITDDTWLITGLNNWPGPYMKYMNQWLTPEDFLRLTGPLKNRQVTLRQILVYQDSRQQKVFSTDINGRLLTEARGTSKYPIFSVVSFDGGDHSGAEIMATGKSPITGHDNSWHDLADWLDTK